MSGRSIGVLLAVGSGAIEPAVLAGLPPREAHVVRRCLDVVELLSTAAAGEADVVLITAAMRGLDVEVVARVRAAGMLVVGVAADVGPEDREPLVRLGVPVVTTDELGGLTGLVERLRAEPPAGHEGDDRPESEAAAGSSGGQDAGAPCTGSVVAVWGPTGAPGRSTVAQLVAGVAADAKRACMLIDADAFGGSQAQRYGLLDESSGLLAAARLANEGRLTPAALASCARAISPGLRVLTGLPRPDRWIELAPVLVHEVLRVARQCDQIVVVDCAFCLEHDDEISYDTSAPRRHAATLQILDEADAIVVVGSADPVGVGRLLRALSDLTDLRDDADLAGVGAGSTAILDVVVNRHRQTLGWPAADIDEIVRRTAGAGVRVVLPEDQRSCDRALVRGRSLVEPTSRRRGGRASRSTARSAGPLVRAARPWALDLFDRLGAVGR